MVRPTDQEMTALGKIACYSSLGEPLPCAIQGHMRMHQGHQEAEEGGKVGSIDFTMFFMGR